MSLEKRMAAADGTDTNIIINILDHVKMWKIIIILFK